MTRSLVVLVAATVLGGVASAQAGTAHITGDGLDFNMESANMPGTLGNLGSHSLSGPELRELHTSLNAAGVNTDGVVTFILANTDSGLSMFTLVDNNSASGDGAIDAMLGMSSTTVSSAGFVMNDLGTDLTGYSDGGSTQTIFGDYFWHPDGGADGMAWTGLQYGDTGTFDFTAYMGDDGDETAANNTTFAGLDSSNTFQFITWTGSTWDTVMTGGFDDGGSFSFAFAIVPLPPALGLGLAGLGAITVVRRRRKKA